MTRLPYDIKKSFFLYLFSFSVACTAYIPLGHSAEVTDAEEQLISAPQTETPRVTTNPKISPPLTFTPSKSYLVFQNILNHRDIWGQLPWELAEQNITSIALYHTGNKLQHQLDKTTLSLIENKLALSLIDNDMRVKTCIQCSKTYINVKKGSIRVKHSAETNTELQAMANDIRANAFLMWDASFHGEVYDIQLKLVNTKTMDVIWTKDITEMVKEDADIEFFEQSNWAFSLSKWGLEAKRLNTTTGETEKVDSFTALGLRNYHFSTLTPNIEYAILFDIFTNLEQTDVINLTGINVEGRIFFHLPDWSETVKLKPYVGVGQLLFNNYHALSFRAGAEISFFDSGFLEVGLISVSEHDIERSDIPDYASTISFGGVSYDITLGYRF